MEKKRSICKVGSIQMRINEDDWLSQVRGCLTSPSMETDEEADQILHSKPRICKVPKEMFAASPESFTPHCISIGPYHRGRPELYAMERYKLAAARRFHSTLFPQQASSAFEETVVNKMKNREGCLRNCYDTFIDCRIETLSWLVTLDAVFLLHCLQVHAGSAEDAHQLGLRRVFDLTGIVSVVKDVVKLENQIPLFAIESLLELQVGEKEAKQRLGKLLQKALAGLSPLTSLSMEEATKKALPSCAHLLDALYFALVPVPATASDEMDAQDKEEEEEEIDKEEVTHTLGSLLKVVSAMNVRPVRHAVSALTKLSKVPLKLVGSLGNLPILKAVKGPLALLFSGAGKEDAATAEKKEDSSSKSVQIEIPPTRDELAVPSVTQLQKAGVRFAVAAAASGVRGVSFDQKARTLYLPGMRIDAHTEVVLRNLIAYEASVAPNGAMEFTRFVDFVNGIVDTAEDVQILRKCGLLQHHLQSDLDVANLCNGMGACVKLSRVDYLDSVVRDVNAFYGRTWRVKFADMLDSYVFGSWQILSLLACISLLALTCLQAFCSVYQCKKWLDPAAFNSR